ncbi:MAG: Smr/MutS family protein [Xanthomonadales bacterium]|nr:putative DNA endonuclease SmrA [Xanthomonadales bacterium]MCC6594743.1 Smr/MutS family protein [Xanthomonadales bacterium]MCE7932456.1 SMR domain protein [Xanthomonadales bacterium PRO6]
MRKRSPPAPPAESDHALFRNAVGPVRELSAATDLRRQTRTLPSPEPLQSQADERRALGESLTQDEWLVGLASGEALAFLQDGYPPRLLRQLRRGQFVIQDELDLHHLRLPQARQLLAHFLSDSRARGHRCLRIVHGKARGADPGSVLKAMVDRELRRRAEVIGYTSARPQNGGTGAVLVLLKT